jgi:DNA polymerase III subunit beta
MNITVSRKDLLRLVGRCQGVVDKKSTMPVLANVLISVDGPNSVRIAATDLYLAVSGNIAAEVRQGGSTAVPARDLFERVKMMPEGPIIISMGTSGATEIRSGTSPRRYRLHGLPGDSFPPLPEPTADATVLELEVEVLSALINCTQFSISTDETRAHLNSAFFEWDGDQVRMVTTDGHRLTKMEAGVSGRQASATMLIPLKAVSELRRLADEASAEVNVEGKAPTVTMAQSGPNAFFTLADTRFCVKLVDAQFPAYQQVIPQTFERTIRAPRMALVDALRAVSLAASDRTGGVKLTLEGGTMRITSESPESGDGFDEVPVDYQGPTLTIGFNARYMLDVLGVLQEEEIQLLLSGELDPAVIRPASEPSSRRFVGVVMPMRI